MYNGVQTRSQTNGADSQTTEEVAIQTTMPVQTPIYVPVVHHERPIRKLYGDEGPGAMVAYGFKGNFVSLSSKHNCDTFHEN